MTTHVSRPAHRRGELQALLVGTARWWSLEATADRRRFKQLRTDGLFRTGLAWLGFPLARRPGLDAISIASAVAALPARPTLHANGTCDSAIDVSSPHLGIKGHMPPWNRRGRQFSAFSQPAPYRRSAGASAPSRRCLPKAVKRTRAKARTRDGHRRA